MATTQPSTPTCVLDRLGSAVTIDSLVRVMAMLWALPASLLTIAGYRFVFDRPPAAVVATYVDVSRALIPLLTAFTVVLGGIWLVRSGRPLATVGDVTIAVKWRTHLGFGLVGLVALGAAIAAPTANTSTLLAISAAGFGFLAGMAIPRWLHAIGDQSDRPVFGWSLLATVMVFEVSIGWFHSMTLVDGASVLSGSMVLGRGLVMCGAIAAVVVWAQTPESA